MGAPIVHQGSVTEITAANQSTVKTYKYDAYGNILQETGPTVPGGITYTGRQYHSRSGLYYYRARWYSPQLGRFLTQDPIGHLGGMNLYAYVGNSPVDFIDPLGLLTWCEIKQKAKDAAEIGRDFVVIPGLTIYASNILANWNPYLVLILPALEYGGALYMWNVETEYQESRRALMDTASRVEARGLDPLIIDAYLSDYKLGSNLHS